MLPGENRVAAALDLARTVVRRAERESVAAAGAGWLDDSRVVPVPQPARRPRVHPRPLAGRCLPARPRALTYPTTQTSPYPDDTGGPVAIRFTVTTRPRPTCAPTSLAVPVFAERTLGPGADGIDAALDGTLDAFMEESGFDGKPGETLLVPGAGRLTAKAALLVGLGKPDDITLDGLRRAAASIARRATKVTSVVTTLVDAAPASIGAEAAAQAVAEGVLLGAYQFLEYKSEAKPSELRQVTVVGGADVKRGVDRGYLVAHAVIWARDMVNEPAGAKSPAEFAAAARRLLSGKGVTVTVLSDAQIRAQRLGGLVGVGQGSSRPPRFVKIAYDPGAGAKGRLALVGKGVVFDSGGLSLKTAGGMETMKTDMSGAAAVVAAMSVLKALGVKTTRHRLRAPGREHAERHGHPPRRRAADPQRQDGRGAQHRRRGPAHPRRRAVARGGRPCRRDRRPRDAHGRVRRRAGREARRA